MNSRASSPDPLPGPLLASGRAADVYDLGDGTVLRRSRRSTEDAPYERRVMGFMAEQHRGGAGVRVPELVDLRPEHDPRRDIVMERIDGVTMFDDLNDRPWKLLGHIKLLARLQRQINAVIAPEWMVAPSGSGTVSQTRHDDSVLHLDLHPMNVMLTGDGPVVIDWTNAAGGPAGFDAALSYVEMATFEVSSTRDRLGIKLGVAAFKRARGRAEIDAFTVAACDHRLADPGTSPGERLAVAALRQRALDRS